jgi:hypothetical protein
MDPGNYTQEKIEEDKDLIVLFIFELTKDTVKNKIEALLAETQKQEQEEFDQMDIRSENPEGDDIVTQLLRQANLLRRQNIDEDQKKKELEEMLKADIRKELENYITYCQSTSVESLINDNPTELRVGEMVEEAKLVKDGLMLPKVNRGHPVHAAPRFDVLVWWRNIGKSVYSKLALGAAIMLGKLAHNGYQERVFSVGKYCDNNLRNRLPFKKSTMVKRVGLLIGLGTRYGVRIHKNVVYNVVFLTL